ncbi:hypothetical protein BOTBODRAFT_239256 [Botryobasidium botryosum FD-172 SS1]|uniref:Uncharacterized protein n=1 Tax=Botryobasidium botryosum (strain FD-172 SS1) TaxID=930990 RepID=A0A067MMG4_BOTB1|nr:hypothetical protein BOTBODRAFT_239256 [Botryobasidium botryosum FD-172 SS1]
MFPFNSTLIEGPEHDTTIDSHAKPSLCTLPIFHLLQPQPTAPSELTGGYISADGHMFDCANPANLRQSYHVIFVIDRYSMPISSLTP